MATVTWFREVSPKLNKAPLRARPAGDEHVVRDDCEWTSFNRRLRSLPANRYFRYNRLVGRYVGAAPVTGAADSNALH